MAEKLVVLEVENTPLDTQRKEAVLERKLIKTIVRNTELKFILQLT